MAPPGARGVFLARMGLDRALQPGVHEWLLAMRETVVIRLGSNLEGLG